MRRPLGVRVRLLLAVVGATGAAVAISIAAFNVFLTQRLSSSVTALARSQAEAELSSVSIVDGKLVAPEGSATTEIPNLAWVFAGNRALEQPVAPEELQEAARSLTTGPARTLGVGEHARLYAVPIVQNGVRYGTVVAAVPTDSYDETRSAALVGSLIVGFSLLVAVGWISWWMLGRALEPVARMTESAEQWSEHDLDQRFNLGEPYDELTKLAATLDALLERIAASLRHEQRLSAELSHELRTPLARVRAETELLLRRPRETEEYRDALEGVIRNVDEMTQTVETLVAAARHDAGLTQATSDLRDAVTAAVESASATRSDVQVRLHLPPGPVTVAVEAELLTRIVRPLIENARRYCGSHVDVSVTAGTPASIDITDDGPGVSPDEADAIFAPGTRGRAGNQSPSGAGLGLALSRRLARTVGGDVTVDPGAVGGHFRLQLPAA